MPQDHWPADQRNRKAGRYEQGYLAHLILQDRLNARQRERFLAEREHDFNGFTRILDIGCGAGSRPLAIAREYTHLEVIGLEEHPTLRAYALAQAEAQGVENIHFLPLARPWLVAFSAAAFDLVNASAPGAFLQGEEWPDFLRTCLHITRPGGYLLVTEPEWGLTNSPALEQLGLLCQQGLRKLGRSYSSTDRGLGIVPRLGSFFTQAGWQDLQRDLSAKNYLMGEDLPADPALRRSIIEHQWEPLIVSPGIASRDEFDYLMDIAEKEMSREDFCGIQLTLAICGRKPD